MKNLLFLLVASLLLLYSCKREEISDPKLESVHGIDMIDNSTLPRFDQTKISRLAAEHKARLANSETRILSRSATINVPADYATIQEAVDAASAGTNIFVNGGTYNETVYVATPGLNIKGVGLVTVNGGFFLDSGADNVHVKNFTIDVTNSQTGVGVLALGVSGGQVAQNTMTGSGAAGAYAGLDGVSVQNMTIRDNNISCEVALGIHIISWLPIGSGMCRDITILQNTVTATNVIALSIEGDTDDSVINGNTVTDNPGAVGIWICGCTNPEEGNYGYCDNIVVKNNVSINNGIWGFLSQDGGTNTTFGPNNTCKDNIFGTYLYFSPGFKVLNNTALQNSACDFVFDNSPGATFTSNTYDCVSGL